MIIRDDRRLFLVGISFQRKEHLAFLSERKEERGGLKALSSHTSKMKSDFIMEAFWTRFFIAD